MKRFFNTFTGRILFGELLIHTLLIPILIFGIVFVVKEGYENRFVYQVRSNALLIADVLSHNLAKENVARVLNDTVITGDVVLAELLYESGESIKSLDNIDRYGIFIEDFGFGQHEDDIYHIAIPVDAIDVDKSAMLRLGYDEQPIIELIQYMYELSTFLAIGYIVMSLIMAGIIGPQITYPLRRLRDAAREITSGQNNKNLNVTTSISEVASLTRNLEQMRQELIKNNLKISSRESYLRAIMDNVVDGILTIDQNGLIISANPAAENIFAYTKNEITGKNINQMLMTPLFFLDQNENSRIDGSEDNDDKKETKGRRKDGSSVPIEIELSQMFQNGDRHYIAVVKDISDRRIAERRLKELHDDLEMRVIVRTQELEQANEELEHQALHDALTGLPNRVLILDRLNQAVLSLSDDKSKIALLMIDLDRFKEINDTLGHHFGDLLLQQVAYRLKENLRDSDTVARLGGDEFAVLLPNVDSIEHAMELAENIICSMDKSFYIEEQCFHIGVSIGIVVAPDHGLENPTLLKHADVAMYVAKRNKVDYMVYDPSHDDHSISKLSMMSELRHAIDHDELSLVYQPKVDIEGGHVIEAEALVRWKHPKRGLVMPDEFISLAEHTGLIKPLTMWVIKDAMRQCHEWRQLGYNIRVSVNLSTRNLLDVELPDYIARLMKSWELSPDILVLEITESAIMSDPVSAMEILSRLHEMGLSLSIDDFGTGYSSLSYLKQLPVDEIKIDKSFVFDMLRNKDDLIIVRSTIDLAHNMGRRVIAEGVESEQIWNKLVELGCDMVQGYYISKPLKPNEMRTWMCESKWGYLCVEMPWGKASN
ncbi:MAG: EAL domain-containing protein [Gammaproteobacteria bacterium]